MRFFWERGPVAGRAKRCCGPAVVVGAALSKLSWRKGDLLPFTPMLGGEDLQGTPTSDFPVDTIVFL